MQYFFLDWAPSIEIVTLCSLQQCLVLSVGQTTLSGSAEWSELTIDNRKPNFYPQLISVKFNVHHSYSVKYVRREKCSVDLAHNSTS